MSGLFSHTPADGEVSTDRPDLRVSVEVPATTDHAWAGLMEHLHLWWPADELSRWGVTSFFDLEDNALVETSAQDDENVWGEVVDGEPGRWLELRWRSTGSDSSTLVRMEVVAGEHGPSAGSAAEEMSGGSSDQDDRATLSVTHSGWTGSDGQEIYDFYQEFWPVALARYRRFMGGS
jgi:hypothetical protein